MTSRPDAHVPLDAKVAFLRRPGSYAEGTRRVEAIETHMSWVFLTDDFAYKLKKPVRYSYLDFSSIDARRHWCSEEVRLNQPLAGSVYLGVIALRVRADGLRIDGDGTVIDWLVKMRRLPATRLLDHAIAQGEVSAAALQPVADRLCTFYRDAPAAPGTAHEFVARLAAEIRANADELNKEVYALPSAPVVAVHAAQLDFLRANDDLFEARVRAGRVIDAHGDLRPEHVCLDPPVVIDRLEFNPAFRRLDIADELAFLALECERLGAPARIAGVFFDTYRALSGDAPPPALADFYRSYRACLRAKIAAWHTTDPTVADPARWARTAQAYLARAAAYAQRFR